MTIEYDVARAPNEKRWAEPAYWSISAASRKQVPGVIVKENNGRQSHIDNSRR
jgi:hypothetical protein